MTCENINGYRFLILEYIIHPTMPITNAIKILNQSIPWKKAKDTDETTADFHFEPHSSFNSQKTNPL